MTAAAVYRHFDADGLLLYVGVTNNPKRRLHEHKCRAVWADQIDQVSVKWYPDREIALARELEAISEENPIFNGGERAELIVTGDAFRDWMAREGLTQEELAKATGMARSTISQMITGKRRTPLRFAAIIEDWSHGEVPCRYWMFGATAESHGSASDVHKLVLASEQSA